EPSVGVDPISRRDLWAMVGEPRAEGIGIVWATAYLDEAEACDHVLLLNQGNLLFSGKPSELTERVDGRVYRLTGPAGRRRQALAQVLEQREVMAGVLQGEAVRLVLRPGSHANAL